MVFASLDGSRLEKLANCAARKNVILSVERVISWSVGMLPKERRDSGTHPSWAALCSE